MLLKTSNVERISITAAGLVGIGTDNPLTTLDVRGLITIGPSQGIQTSVDNSNIYIWF